MKILLSIILFVNFFYCKENNDKGIDVSYYSTYKTAEENYNEDSINLYDFIGINIKSEEFKEYAKNLGEFEIRDFSDSLKDYVFENDGIQFRTNLSGEIEVIFCFNYKIESWKPKSFKGQLPFNLTFSDTFAEIKEKIGEGSLFDRNGFYGRIFTWEIEEIYNVAIELRLPDDNEKQIFIEMISLSKNKE